MKKILLLAIASFTVLFTNAQPCSDLFFSEYVEGTSNNKALEIYNPTAASVDLTGYSIILYTNGSSIPGNTLLLSGTISPGDVYVVANPSAGSAINAEKDTASNATNFNGNDAIGLYNGTTLIDLIGEIGFDPGASGWTVGSGSTLNSTLVRKASVNEGSTDWTVGVSQWDVLAVDVIQLGSHTMTPCAAPTDTLASFSPASASVSEAAGTYNITVALNQAADVNKTVDVVLTAGDAADVDNFSSETVTFATGETSKTVTLNIVDNANVDGNRTVTFELQNPSTGLLLGNQTFTLNITDDEVSPNIVYPISVLRTVNADGIPDSIGVVCEVRGTVLGINNRSTGIQFTIYDGTGGIGVFSPTNTFGYTVTEGDSIAVVGKVGQFNGLTQMTFLDTVYKIGTGNLPIPKVVSFPDEATESELVRINNVTITNPASWDNTNPTGFTVDALSGTNEFEIRIDEQSALFNEPVPQGVFDIIGIGGQFDATVPHTSFYSISPRYLTDIILLSSVAEKSKGVNNLNLYPNPAADKVFVSFNAEKNATGTLAIFDLSGKEVLTNSVEIINGLNTIETNIKSLNNGLFLLKISANSIEINQQIIISK